MKSARVAAWAIVVTVAIAAGAVRAADAPAAGSAARADAAVAQRWVYAPCNFQVDEQTDALAELARRAKKAGYTAMVVGDTKFGKLEGRPARYYENVKRFRQATRELGIGVMAGVMPIGYSNSLLQNDPNLAEGIAVRECPFVVRGGRATVAGNEEMLPFGDFEGGRGDRFEGWDFVDGPGKSSFRDEEVRHGGKASVRFQDFRAGNEAGNARLHKKLAVEPWGQYAVGVWIRTRDVAGAGDIRVAVLGKGGRSLNYTNLGVKATQDWTQHRLTFNTMDNDSVGFYVGLWSGRTGTMWVDDVSVRRTAGVNLLRREGCPIDVTSEDGATRYVEGRDFEKWEYAKMGRLPWAGEYEAWHPEPGIVLAKGSRIGEGQRLKVSYYHTAIIYDGQVSCCLVHPEVYRLLETEVRLVQKYLQPDGWFMNHDELRVAGQCELCRKTGKAAGELLAENVRRCAEIVRAVDKKGMIAVWSDMFDPFHNAHDNYYLVGSTLEGSWAGLDKGIVIANWNRGKAAQSLGFFAERGHRQVLAGYYDSGAWKRDLEAWLKTAREAGGVDGVMYTTWQRKYGEVEAFGEVLRGR